MIDKPEKTFHDIKTSALKKPEAYILTHNRLKIYMLLIYDGLNKAQIYKLQCRVSPYKEIETLTSFDYLNVFKPNELTDHYLNRVANNENFLFDVKYIEYAYVGDRVISFETDDVIVEYSSEQGFNNVKFPFARGEKKVYFKLH